MRYVEAPDLTLPRGPEPRLFLAGGITDCPDWQADVVEALADEPVTILNPRRADFPMGDEDAGREQIAWEWQMLNAAHAVSFWFPKETLNPIVLFELGYRLGQDSQHPLDLTMFVGTDPAYQRRFDVVEQVQLRRPEVYIAEDLDRLVGEIREWLAAY